MCHVARHDGRVSAGGYESWFVSARDPASPRWLWIRHTRLRPRGGPELAALWCTVADRGVSERPVVIKQVFAAFPPGTTAGAGQFRGQAALGPRSAAWDLAITGGQPWFRPLRPQVLYRAPLPRTKLEAPVPDGLVTGVLSVDGHRFGVEAWRGTVGHNWGKEHADCWVWLHAAGFATAPRAWLDLVLAKIKVGPVRSPWAAMGALSLGGELIWLGGLGRRPRATVHPHRLTADIPAPAARLTLTVTTSDDDAAAVAYTDPRGGTRAVRHAALATVELTLSRPGESPLTMSGSCATYEHGTSQGLPGTILQPLPEG